MQYISRCRCRPDDIVRLGRWYAGGTQGLNNSQPPEKLHATAIGEVHLGMTCRGCVSLKKDRMNAMVSQLQSQGHAHRTPSSDYDLGRVMCHWNLLLHTPTPFCDGIRYSVGGTSIIWQGSKAIAMALNCPTTIRQ